jgi:[ribosomal protein S5]-alanine N-acetyltransferase
MSFLPPILTTERLILRPIAVADTDAIFVACSQPRLTEFTLFETHETRAASESFVKNYAIANYSQGALDPLGIALKESPEQLVGSCGLMLTEAPFTREIGYWIAEAYWNRGYATEVVTRLTELGFQSKARRIQARVIVGNSASERVLQKAGFAHEGTHRSALYRRGQFWDVMMFAKINSDIC